MNFHKYLETTLSDEDMVEIIANWEQLEDQGQIGDCKLRSVTQDYLINHLDVEMHNTVLWMEKVAKYCWREFAWRYMDLMD